MKNIIKFLSVAVVMILALSSCRDNAKEPDHGPVVHPQEDAQGTYSGTWTRETAGSNAVVTAPGTLVFVPGEYNYVTSINAICPDAQINLDLTSLANITPGGEGYQFNNTQTTNGFGGIFSGGIKKSDMTVWLTLKKTVKTSAIKSTTYTYTFEGKRD